MPYRNFRGRFILGKSLNIPALKKLPPLIYYNHSTILTCGLVAADDKMYCLQNVLFSNYLLETIGTPEITE